MHSHHRDQLSDAALEENSLPVETEVLRAWIATARQEVYPIIGDELREKIVDAYVSFRNEVNTGSDSEVDPVPLTARKIEAIMRLVEASARVELRERATEADLQRATDLIRASLEQVGRDPETGQYDADMVEAGQSKSQAARKEAIEELIRNINDGGNVPVAEVVDSAVEAGYDHEAVKNDIETFKRQGDVIEYTSDGEDVVEWVLQ
jgi:replicative DNA helicase Mcm